MLNNLKNAYTRLVIGKSLKIKYTKSQMKDYIYAFGEPRDDIERSYFQYCCQRWASYGKTVMVIANLVSMILYLPYYYYYRFMSNKPITKRKYPYVATEELILRSIPDEYVSKCVIPDFYRGMLMAKDLDFLKLLFQRYPFSFYFQFKVMCRIANYSYIIQTFSPNIIFSSAEYSFTSSILTMYCDKMGVELDNVMHGEKLFDIRDSFSRFTRFYVWDDFYKNLFLSLRADKTEYIVRPIKVPQIEIKHNEKHYTYYLQAQTFEQLKAIKNKFESMNVDYLVRPHPVYSTEDVNKVFDEEHIESSEIDIWDSIKVSGHVVSVDSTVNYQAYLVGVEVVLDDISNPEYYLSLAERDYIMIQKPHILFSQL